MRDWLRGSTLGNGDEGQWWIRTWQGGCPQQSAGRALKKAVRGRSGAPLNHKVHEKWTQTPRSDLLPPFSTWCSKAAQRKRWAKNF